MKSERFFLFIGLLCCIGMASASHVWAANPTSFNVATNFDASGRSHIQGALIKTTGSLYFYVDQDWWMAQSSSVQNLISTNLDAFSTEFDSKIYPTLTSVFGREWRPGIDNDNHITILFHPLKGGATGYFRSNDEYPKIQVPDSNEREMIYLSTDDLQDSHLKIFAAHEFTHLITFNQKDRLQGISEDIWLNEGRADYAPAILGYDTPYEGSNLQRRVSDFLDRPTDPLAEWKETRYDYAVDNIFINYLVEHYGVEILSNSLHANSVGIASINEVLAKQNSSKTFADIFTDWAIATLINDCSVDQRYCYLNQSLENFRINPTLNFLPVSGNSSLSVNDVVKSWVGNWQKIIGGHGDLTLTFSSSRGKDFRVPYIIVKKDNTFVVNFLTLDSNGKGSLTIKDFDTSAKSLVIIPLLETANPIDTASYGFTVSVGTSELPNTSPTPACTLVANLYIGVAGAPVRCLQTFLKNQGTAIYPAGLVTGYFGSLTRAAVIRFQKQYGIPSTGFVGPLTRAKINQLMYGG